MKGHPKTPQSGNISQLLIRDRNAISVFLLRRDIARGFFIACSLLATSGPKLFPVCLLAIFTAQTGVSFLSLIPVVIIIPPSSHEKQWLSLVKQKAGRTSYLLSRTQMSWLQKDITPTPSTFPSTHILKIFHWKMNDYSILILSAGKTEDLAED